MPANEQQVRSLLELLESCSLEHLRGPLQGQTLACLTKTLDDAGRPALLKLLKDCEVAKLPERQKLATELAKAHKGGMINYDHDIPPGPPIDNGVSAPPAAPDPESGLRPALVCFCTLATPGRTTFLWLTFAHI